MPGDESIYSKRKKPALHDAGIRDRSTEMTQN